MSTAQAAHLAVGIERHARLVQTFGINPVEVMFGYNAETNEYTAEVANMGEYLLIRKPDRRRVQFEDGDWHTIPEGYWICERVERNINGHDLHCGVSSVMPTPQQAFVEAFNQHY